MKAPQRLGALEQVARVLQVIDVAYLVGGSVASARWGVPRLTNDIDVVVQLPASAVSALVRELEQDFYVDRAAVIDAVRIKRSFNIVAREDFTKVDVFVADESPWQRSQLARRRLERLSEDASAQSVYIASPEDTVLAKLLWFEKGNRVSDRQWQDVLGVVRVQGASLDVGYLRTWAADLGVSALLEDALEQADAGRRTRPG